jgi:sugar phosphate isomerase/epimerase
MSDVVIITGDDPSRVHATWPDGSWRAITHDEAEDLWRRTDGPSLGVQLDTWHAPWPWREAFLWLTEKRR